MADVPSQDEADNLDVLQDVPLTFSIVLGRTRMRLDQLAELGEQAQIDLDRRIGETVDILANGKPFARGEVVTVDENFGVRIVDILRPLDGEEAGGGA